jgi:hypothetical protein
MAKISSSMHEAISRQLHLLYDEIEAQTCRTGSLRSWSPQVGWP